MLKKQKNIQVAVRMRPLLDRYQDHQAWIANPQIKSISSIPRKMLANITNISNISNNQDSSLSINKKRPSKIIEKNNIYEFSYDYVFSQAQNNYEVYSQSCQKIVQQFINGKNASIFMYGQTTSGKTYTMIGGNGEEGLIMFSLKNIFKKLNESIKNKQYNVLISYMQIYNQQINDLLDPEGLNLRIADDNVQNLTEFKISSSKQAISLLEQGQKLRSYAERTFHDHSSRSHTIFQIKLIQIHQETGKIISKNVLNLVDLAGSQRVGQQDSNEETGYINKSLFVLSNVIHKLSQKKRQHSKNNFSNHIPFRDSKLTRVLSSSLTTSSHTIFICTISPAQVNFNQTLSTLRFANQSRKVQLKCIQDTLILSQSSFIMQKQQISKLKEENISLKKNLSEKQKNETFTQQKSLIQHTIQKLQNMILLSCKQNIRDSLNNRSHHTDLSLSIQNNDSIKKLQDLHNEFQRNVIILQKEYSKAMINLVSTQLRISKEQIHRKVGGNINQRG